MEVYNTEQEQIEAIRKWWMENGKSAVLGVVLGLGAIFGWRAWQAHEIEQAEAASELYQSSLVAMGQDNRDEARLRTQELITNYGDTGYALFARLILAYLETDEGNYSQAEEQLKLALDAADNDTIKQEINLRLARVYMANDKLDQALSQLNSRQPGSFATQYNELKGDIYALQGKNDEALLAYQQALAEAGSGASDPALLNLKINSLQ